MTRDRQIITTAQVRRLAQAAKDEGCVLEVVKGDTTLRIIPNKLDTLEPVTLDSWRNRGRQCTR